jgi:hypothetical protein
MDLAAAGIDQEAQRERNVGLSRKVTDRLRPAVLLQREIILIEVVDDAAVAVANRSQKGHQIDRCGKRYLLRGGPPESGEKQAAA